jgi:iron complex outermembrane receptor protein
LVHLLERSNWSLESGLSGGYQDNYPNPATKARRLIPDYYRYDAGAFSVFKYRFSSKLNAEAAVRYDFSRYDAYKYYDSDKWEANFAAIFPQFFVQESGSRTLTRPILDYHNLSANLGLDYKPTQNYEFKLNLSRVERSPNPAELFADGLHHSAAIIERGDLTIKKEALYNVNLSFVGNFNILKGLHLEINPYLMYSDSFINQIPTGYESSNRSGGGAFPIWTYQQIKARMIGVDADAELSILDNLKWKSSFSILRGDDLSNHEPLILMMPTKLRNSIELNLSKPKNFYITLENDNTFKQNRFPMTDIPFTYIKDGQIIDAIIDFSSTPAAYTLFNATIGADLYKNLNLNFRINNLFNTEYREYLNRLRYYMFEPGRNFVVTLKYNF